MRSYQVSVHSEGHYFQTADGLPFFWLADTAWQILHDATPTEAKYYLAERARQGFTVIQAVILSELNGLLRPNTDGDLPFDGADSDQLNPRYFDRIAEFIAYADSLGLQVALLPTWGDKLTAPWGDGPRIFGAGDGERAKRFARQVAAHLAGFSNIVWLLGGDRPPKIDETFGNWYLPVASDSGFPTGHDFTPLWRAMAEGLTEGGLQRPCIGYHPQAGEASTSYFLHDEPWLSFNAVQSGHSRPDLPVWEWLAHDWKRLPAKPTLDLEINYEDHPVNPWPVWNPDRGYFRDYEVRKQCWRSVFAGGAGVTYGHHSVWQWANGKATLINLPDRSWSQALARPGAQQVGHLRRFLESRPFFTRIPAPDLVSTRDEPLSAHPVATRDRDGRFAAVYFPLSEQRVEVDLSVLAGDSIVAWWFDPRTGLGTPAGLHPSVRTVFQSPSWGPDWVLVLDDARENFGAPALQSLLQRGKP